MVFVEYTATSHIHNDCDQLHRRLQQVMQLEQFGVFSA